MIGNKREHVCGYRPVQAILGKKFLRLRVIDFAGFRYDSGKRVAMVLAECDCGNTRQLAKRDLGRTKECRPCALKSRRAKGHNAVSRTVQRKTRLDTLNAKQHLYFDVLMVGRSFLTEEERKNAIEDAMDMVISEKDLDAAIKEWTTPLWRETRNRCSLLNELLVPDLGEAAIR